MNTQAASPSLPFARRPPTPGRTGSRARQTPRRTDRRDTCPALDVELGVHAERSGVLVLRAWPWGVASRPTGSSSLSLGTRGEGWSWEGGDAYPGPRQGVWEPRTHAVHQYLKRFQDLSSLLCTPVLLSRADSFLKIVLMWDASQSLRSMGQTTDQVLPTAELWGRRKRLCSRCSLPGDRECTKPAPGPCPATGAVPGHSALRSLGPPPAPLQCSVVVFLFPRGLKKRIRIEIWKMDAGPRAPSCS